MWLVLTIIFAVLKNKIQVSFERSWPFTPQWQNLHHRYSIKQAGFSTELGRGHAWLQGQKMQGTKGINRNQEEEMVFPKLLFLLGENWAFLTMLAQVKLVPFDWLL